MKKMMITAAVALVATCATVAAAQQKEVDLTEHDKPPVDLRFDDSALTDEIVLRAAELEPPVDARTLGYEPPAYVD